MSHGWLGRLRSSGVGLAFALGLLTAGLLHLPYQSAAQQQAAQPTSVVATGPGLPRAVGSLQDLSEAFASVAEHVKPSVVYIKSGHKATRREMRNNNGPRMLIPPGFEQFF